MRAAHFFLSSLVLGILGFVAVADAATLRIAPSSANANAGGSVSISVIVSSSDQAMNAASGVLKFPADLLQVSSISKSGSVIGLWVQEPSHSNVAGTVNFEGVVLNPGFTGGSGTVITVTFRAVQPGTASLSITSGSVLANDGNGTEILTSSSGGAVTISEGTAPAPVPASTQKGKELVVTSSTHPDQTKSYRAETVELAWKLPEGTEAVRILYDKNPRTTPTVLYDPPINSKTITPGEGAWYFHAQARNEDGWGPVTHFRFTIDPNAPLEIIPAPATTSEEIIPESNRESKSTQVLANLKNFALPFALVLLALFLGWYLLYHHNTKKRVHGTRVSRVQNLVHEEFQDLKDALKEEISSLERIRTKRDLTAEEERIIARFNKMLDKSERVIEKEIDDISER